MHCKESSHTCQDAVVHVPGEPGEGPPMQQGWGAAAARCREALPPLSWVVERGPVRVWCCHSSSVQSQRLTVLARN